MDNKRYTELAQLILEGTKNQTVLWSPSSNANTYQAKIGQGAVLVHLDTSTPEYFVPDLEFPIGYISFLNNRGESIYNLYVYNQEESNFFIVDNLYKSAKDSYLKTNETIQSMFDELKSSI